MALIAATPDSKAFVCVDGPTLLIYPLEMGRDPWWLKALGQPIVGVGIHKTSVLAVGAGGEISWWRVADGQPIARHTTGFSTRAVTHRDGTVVLLGDSVRIFDASNPTNLGSQRDIPFLAVAAALSGRADRLGLVSEDGRFRLFDAHSGAKLGEVDVDVPLRGVAWRADGTWTVTGGERIYSIDGALVVSVITRAAGYAPSNVAWAPEGNLLAIQIGPSTMIAMAFPSKESAVQLSYPERTIVDVGAPGWPYVIVGLDQGDGNWAQMDHPVLLRTDPLPERQRNRWLVNVTIDGEHARPPAPPPSNRGEAVATILIGIFVAIGVLLALGLAMSRC